MENQTISG